MTFLAEIVVGRGRRDSGPESIGLVMNRDLVFQAAVENDALDMT